MKYLLGFLLGLVVATAGQLLAQTGFQSDNQGNMSLFYYNPPQYPQPMPQQDWNGPSRNMQQNLNEIIRQGNPC